MTSLERRYRLLLRAYPLDYRDQRAEEIIDTLLACAGESQRHPTVRQTIDLVLNGIRVRAERTGHTARRHVRHHVAFVSATAIVALIVLATLVPISERRAELPVAFIALWASIALLPALLMIAPRLVSTVGWISVIGATTGAVIGPSYMLMQRTLLIAVAMYACIIVVSRCESPPKLTRAISGATGIVLGVAGSIPLRHRPFPPPDRVEWHAWKINRVLPPLDTPGWVLLGGCVIVAIGMCLLTRGTGLIVMSCVAVPTTLTLAALTDHVSVSTFSPAFERPLVVAGVTAVVAALGAAGGYLTTLKPQRQRSSRA
jgi:hypothetical protein